MNDEKHPSISPFHAAQSLFQECTIVSRFIIETVRPSLPNPDKHNDMQTTVYGLLLRVDCWLRTLQKCCDPSDYQAVGAAARALLEIAVDLVLINKEPANANKMAHWEDSAKLKQATALTECYSQKGKSHEDIDYLVDFIKQNKERIEKQRTLNGWTRKDEPAKTIHPQRWTKSDLKTDCIKASNLSHFDFHLFYEQFHSELCWSVHGSGLSLVRNMDPEIMPMVGGFFFLTAPN